MVLRGLSVDADDPYNAVGLQITEWRIAAGELKDFKNAHSSSIPRLALLQLEDLEAEGLVMQSPSPSIGALSALMVLFSSSRARFDFYSSGTAELMKSRVERAFIHLQQLIVVDQAVQSAWSTAYHSNETKCERLGAVHLLLHGIWSFKAHGVGARTDLVLQEPLDTATTIERAADALVLTEWKMVRANEDHSLIADKARRQAHLYGTGVLSKIELAEQRYVVLVSNDRLPRLSDELLDGITYRHVNIAVNPSTPSRAA